MTKRIGITFCGAHSEEYNALKAALETAAGGEDNEHIYSYMDAIPKTSLVVDLADALREHGYQITKMVLPRHLQKDFGVYVPGSDD